MAALVLMMWGAPRAEAVPSVTFECTPAPADCSGWYRSNVSIDWTVLPSNATVLAGCQDKTLTTDTTGTTEFCSARDGSTLSVEVPIQIDKTPPTVLGGQPDRGADFGGWYTRPVSVVFNGTDQTSGIEGCTTKTYSGPDSGSASLTGSCMDKAGNVGTLGYGLNYDTTPPSVTGAGPARSPNPAGWFNAPVEFDFQGSDATSGIASCTTLTYSGPQTAAGSVSGTCRDRAGHSTRRSFPIKYDATAPSGVAGQAARGPDRNGWYNRAVRVDFTGLDALSSIQSCSSPTYSGPDGRAVSVSGTCTDVAGNTSNQASLQLNYDDTAPVVMGGAPARQPDSNGWYNRPVTVGFSGRDTTSGVESCTAPTYGGPDTDSASVSGTCIDVAGNTSGPQSVGFKYDGTPPTQLSATPERGPDANGWYTGPVKFTVAGTDAMSGIESCPAVTYAGPDGAGAAVIGECRDRAANVASRAFGLKFDATAPAVMDLAATAADRSVALSWRTSPDAETVGVMRTPGIGFETATHVFAGPGTSFVDGQVENGVRYAYEVRARDAAGNVGAATVTATPLAPAATFSLVESAGGAEPAAGLAGGGVAQPVTVDDDLDLHLIAPAARAVFRTGQRPLLRWTPVPGASYYNLQLFRRGKILTAWPSKPQHRLKLRWRYRGKRYRLSPGEYHWIVWPGFGPRSKADYGRRIGRRSFVVRAASR